MKDTAMTEFETILLEKGDDKVATVTLNRPQALNAFNWTMCTEFESLWPALAQDDDVNAIVLRAAPGRAFCTGMDVREGKSLLGSDNEWNKRDPGERLGPKQNRCWKPVIAAVHGMCAGGAFYWLNEADVVVCAPNAQFFDPHVTFGMTAALEPIGLRWRIALPEVLRMALMGNDERICADTALRISLVTEIVEEERLWQRAHEIAASIARKPSVATQGTVRAIWESLDCTRNAGLQMALKYCQIGNPRGTAEVNRGDVMAGKQLFAER
ncbi:MAG: enoyl-CoA hydratase/isomerase family protein [Hyphomonadaceae bacterium]|nr:enoyl-CoA hydratase/isomerase family protein [Hyphomonadaceae bacterium]